jgi:hypothetical protein
MAEQQLDAIVNAIVGLGGLIAGGIAYWRSPRFRATIREMFGIGRRG